MRRHAQILAGQSPEAASTTRASIFYEKETITGDEFMEILERKELPEAEPQA